MKEKTVTAILLAAGRSTRFGGDKLALKLPNGLEMARHCARQLRCVFESPLAVVCSGENSIADLLRAEGLRIVTNPFAEQGIGTSIACAVRASAHADAWLIALADMPRINAGVIGDVYRAMLNGAHIAAPYAGNRQGHPVGFAKAYFQDLTNLNGDRGGKTIIDTNRRAVEKIPVHDPALFFDIDAPSDFECFITR